MCSYVVRGENRSKHYHDVNNIMGYGSYGCCEFMARAAMT